MVRKLSTDTVLNLWEVRQALEAVAAERFARHGSPEQVERLDDAIRQMDAALRARDRKKIKLAKSAIFEAFAAGAQNDMLAAYIRQINATELPVVVVAAGRRPSGGEHQRDACTPRRHQESQP